MKSPSSVHDISGKKIISQKQNIFEESKQKSLEDIKQKSKEMVEKLDEISPKNNNDNPSTVSKSARKFSFSPKHNFSILKKLRSLTNNR